MKRTLIACLFTFIFLLSPCSAAITIPVSTTDQQQLQHLINQEKTIPDDTLLTDLLADIQEPGNTLHLDTVETILIYLRSNDQSIREESLLQTESWQWIMQRLGWIYHTTDHLVILVNQGNHIITVFRAKTNLITGWYQSITAMKQTWQDFKTNPELMNLLDFVKSVTRLATLTKNLVNDLTDDEQELITALTDFQEEIQIFSDFLSSEPWKAPITIKGTVNGVTNQVTISCNGNTVNTTTEYMLSIPTQNSSFPWWIHRCTITAQSADTQQKHTSYAFSQGSIEADFDLSQQNKAYRTTLHYFLLYLYERFSIPFTLFHFLLK